MPVDRDGPAGVREQDDQTRSMAGLASGQWGGGGQTQRDTTTIIRLRRLGKVSAMFGLFSAELKCIVEAMSFQNNSKHEKANSHCMM